MNLELLTPVFIGIILSATVLVWLRQRRLHSALAALDAFNTEDSTELRDNSELTKGQLDDIADDMAGRPLLKPLAAPLRELAESIFPLTTPEGKTEWLNAHQAEDFINPELFEDGVYADARSLPLSAISPHVMTAAPGLLTAIGILGTFLGLVLGLAEAAPSGGDIKVSVIVQGLKVSFWSSVAGLGASILVTLWNRQLAGRLDDTVGELIRLLNAAMKRGTTQEVMAKLLRPMATLKSELGTEFADAIATHLQPVLLQGVEQIATQVVAKLQDKIDETIGVLKKTTEAQTALVNRYSEVTATLTPELERFQGAMQAAQPGLKRLSVTAERLETASISMEKATEATEKSCAELDAQVANRLTEAQQRLEAAFKQVTQTIQPSLDELTEASASLGEASGALKLSAVTAQESTTALDAIFDKKLVSLQMGTRDLERAAANLGPICVSLQALEAGLTSGLDSFASQFKPSIEKAMGTFDSEMAGVARQLNQVTRNLQESFDELNAQLSELLIEEQGGPQPPPSPPEGRTGENV